MYFTYITALEHLKISAPIVEPISIGNGLFLGTSIKHVKIPNLALYAPSMGRLEFNGIFGGSVFVFKRAHAINLDAGKIELINFMRNVNAYIHVLWLMRDNSVNFGLGFALCESEEFIHSNSLSQYYTKSDGQISELELSLDEVEESAGIVGEVFSGAKEQEFPKFTALQKSTDRLSASNFHLQTARSNNDLGLKIAQMCTYFECLFSTSTAELSHQLSERIAFFIESEPVERLKTYKQIKKAYSIRSKIVHGDRINKNLNELVEISSFCDDVARKINEIILPNAELVRILNSPDQSLLDSYMVNLIFGVKS